MVLNHFNISDAFAWQGGSLLRNIPTEQPSLGRYSTVKTFKSQIFLPPDTRDTTARPGYFHSPLTSSQIKHIVLSQSEEHNQKTCSVRMMQLVVLLLGNSAKRSVSHM